MVELRAYDPGDKYTGVAYFRQLGEYDIEDERLVYDSRGWECYNARVADPDEALDELGSHLITGRVLYVVYERFRLYPDKAKAQANSEFLTSQSIGVIRWLVRNCSATRVAQGKTPIELVAQGAEDKHPTREILRSKGIKSTAKRLNAGPGAHALDAELHGWRYILRTLQGEV